MPIIYFFEKVLNWKVEFKSIFNNYEILNSSPDILILSNTNGALRNAELVKKKDSGILVFSHQSEGFFTEKSIDGFFWGCK